MTHARFVVTVPERLWLSTLSREHPDATFRLLSAIQGGERSYGLLWVTAPDVGPLLDALADVPALTEQSVLHRTDREAALGFESSDLFFLDIAGEAGTPIDMPVEFEHGFATVDVVGLPAWITRLGQAFEDRSIEFRIVHIRDEVTVTQRLTQKQRESVARALEMGYYDTPRECSLTDLADSMGLAKSTISETLHRAEEVLIKEAIKSASHDPQRRGTP